MMKKIAVLMLLAAAASIYADETVKPVPSPHLNALIAREKSAERVSEILALFGEMDRVYGDVYGKLSSGGKIVVFMDPVHGMVKSGSKRDWEGNLSWRKSTTGLPEEYYSIPLARLLYKKLIESGHFEVASTPDYLEVLRGKSDVYDNITFDETVKYARSAGAFIILAEHLNNVSPIHKADGFVNIKGIHLTCTEWRTPMISYVGGIYRGYFTYYSSFDTTGTSRAASEGFRDRMLALGHEPNSWDYGAVADTNFSIYTDFPISYIYESAFISNPEEEKLLRDETFQETLEECKFDGIVASIERTFGVDLSSSSPDKKRAQDPLVLDLIKLQRLVSYYCEKAEFTKAVSAIDIMEKIAAGTKFKNNIRTYTHMKDRLNKVNSLRLTALSYTKKKKFALAHKTYTSMLKTMGHHPMFNLVKESVYQEQNIAARALGKREQHYYYALPGHYEVTPPELSGYPTKTENHTLYTPYLITIAEGQSLETAVELSIAPRDGQASRIVAELKNGVISKTVYNKVYSKKTKKYVYRKSTVKTKAEFTPGLYIVSFDKNLGLKNVIRTNSVPYDPNRYQNQQYFKNSSLAQRTKEKAL